jgi:hypothetical protein
MRLKFRADPVRHQILTARKSGLCVSRSGGGAEGFRIRSRTNFVIDSKGAANALSLSTNAQLDVHLEPRTA